MPIQVTCTGCHARFKVSDKFAGKEGPCPKCKTKLKIPTKEEEVVIHAPDEFEGAKDSTGKSVLKPIERTETKFSLPLAIISGAACLIIPILAFVFGKTYADAGGPPAFLLGLGALLLAFPLAWAGYALSLIHI